MIHVAIASCSGGWTYNRRRWAAGALQTLEPAGKTWWLTSSLMTFCARSVVSRA